MKQFLRFQISGTTFYIWLFIFLFGIPDKDGIQELILNIKDGTTDENKYLTGYIAFAVASALPVGTIIHQLSVLIKNWVLVKLFCLDSLSDKPYKNAIERISPASPKIDYILERVSNLNSFYYVRVDNGILAPLIAWIAVCIFADRTPENYGIAITIGAITSIYLYSIYKELGEYRDMLNYIKEEDTNHD